MDLNKTSKPVQLLTVCIIFILILPLTLLTPFYDTDPAEVNAETTTGSEHTEPSGTRGGEHSSRNTIDREIPDSEVMYAIIAPEQFKDTLIPLVNWKTYKGVPAKIFTLESILADHTSGRDDAENLHDFLMNLHENSKKLENNQKTLTWLLLAGDSDIIPIRWLYADAKEKYNLDEKYVSDYYYAGLSNDWDKNNDGIYGDGLDVSSSPLKFEGDWEPEVYVGRLPVGSVSDLTSSVEDILTYEQNPPPGTWMKTVVEWGGLMDAPNVVEYTSYDTNAYKAKELYVKPIIEDKAPHMYITTRYDYPQLEGGNYSTDTDGLNQPFAVQDMNLGASLVNFAGQAYYEGVALIHYIDPYGTKYIGQIGAFDQLYSWQDARDATNSKRLPLATFFTCGSGDFAEAGGYEDKTMERLLTAPNGGAIGLVGSTGKTYRGESQEGNSDGNWWLDKHFYEIFFNGTYQPGKCLYKLKEQYVKEILSETSSNHEIYKAMLFGYNYQGDPELHIWTDEPSELEINVSGLWCGPHNITVTVCDQSKIPVPGARVCIQNDDIYVYGVTNSTGAASIYANPPLLGSVDVVVTAHNFLPLEESLTIGIEPPDLKITNNDLDFSIPSPMVNQQISINATVQNRGGTDTIADFKVRFYLDALTGNGGTVIGTDQVIPGLAKGNSKTVNVNWLAVPGEHTIFVEVDPENEIDEAYEWNNIASKTIYVRKPELYITHENITFTPDVKSLDAYEGVNIKIKATINNIGEAPAYNVKVCFIDRSESLVERFICDNKTISVIPAANQASVTANWIPTGGAHEIEVQIDPENNIPEFNETNNTASTNVTIKYPPRIIPLPDLQLNEDTILENATDLIWYIYDNDTKFIDLYITLDSSNENCSVILNDYYHLDVIPAADWFGTVDVTIQVNDGFVSANDTFKVMVIPQPDAPRVIDSNFTIYATEDEEFSYYVKAFDPDCENVTYTDDLELFEIDPITGEIRFTPTQDQVNISPINFNITLSDGDLSTKNMFKLIVENVPDPPILFPVPDQYAQVNKKFKLQIIAIDVDSIKLYFYDDTNLFTIDINTGIIEFTPKSDEIDVHIIKIIVTDDDNLPANITFKLTINASDDPVIITGDGNETTNDKDEINWGVIAGVIILIIIIPLIIFIFFKRRQKNKTIADDFFHPEYEKEKERSSHFEGTADHAPEPEYKHRDNYKWIDGYDSNAETDPKTRAKMENKEYQGDKRVLRMKKLKK